MSGLDTKVRPFLRQVVVVPTATADDTLQELRDSGFVPVMTDFPDRVKIIKADGAEHEMLMAAMHALAHAPNFEHCSSFVKTLERRLCVAERPMVVVTAEGGEGAAEV